MNKDEKDLKFMIVDDDSDDCELFSEALNAVAPSSQCVIADDGKILIGKLNSAEILPDIVFLDINLPEISGWQCLVEIKKHVAWRNIPIIIHSTSTRKTDFEIAKDLGANCYITKVNDFSNMKNLLKIIVEQISKDAPETICDEVNKYLQAS